MKGGVRLMVATVVAVAGVSVVPGKPAVAHETVGEWHVPICPDLAGQTLNTTMNCAGDPESPLSGTVTHSWRQTRESDGDGNLLLDRSAGTSGNVVLCRNRTINGDTTNYEIWSLANTTYSTATTGSYSFFENGAPNGTTNFYAFFAPPSVTSTSQCGGYDAGEPVPPSATGEPANYECGRTLDEAGDGRYFVNLRALGPANPVNDGVTETVRWEAEWDGWVSHEGKQVELLTPPLLEMPSGGWVAKFIATRTFAAGVTGDKRFTDAPPEEIDWAQFDEGNDPGGVPGWGLIPDTPRNAYQQFEELLDNALGRLASRIRFWEDDEAVEPMTQADVEGEVAYTKVESECRVLVDPRNPERGASGSTNISIYNPEGFVSPTDEELAGEDPAQGNDESCTDGIGLRLNWNPLVVIGSALNTIVKPLLCGLKALFIPENLNWDALWGDVQGGFPFTIMAEIAGVFDAIVDTVSGSLTASACVSVDATAAVPYAQEYGHTVGWDMPSPTGSGCVGAGTEVGNLFGYRELFRNLMAGGMWVGVMVGLSGRVGPKGNELGVPV